jgi:polar amino acid transport system substrate-binding protein
MKQLIQDLRDGSLTVDELPPPACPGGHAPGVLVANVCSLISPGTERAAVELGRGSLLEKARRRPDLVRQVIENFRREGFWQTYQKVRSRLNRSRTLGYSSAGVVLASEGCDGEFSPGDRVACAGADYATHGEVIYVPRNLCVRLPDRVEFDEAAFVALGAIALHAVRVAETTIGERVAVVGLGLLGLLTVQLLKAAGCAVCALDLLPERVALADGLGADSALLISSQDGQTPLEGWQDSCDAVFVTAASSSDAPVQLGVRLLRDRGRLVIVGDVRTNLDRNEGYRKELRVLFSRSYGPGRYDPAYEEQGHDYPIAYVRWTERRNMEAFLQLVARGQVRTKPLVTHRFPIEEAPQAYELITGQSEKAIAVLLEYSARTEMPLSARVDLHPTRAVARPVGRDGRNTVGFIGAGNFARACLLPPLQRSHGVKLTGIATTRGVTAKEAAKQFGFGYCTTDPAEILADPETDTVFIATRHDSHAGLVVNAIEAGKNVFVEKPLCLNREELARIEAAYRARPVVLMVGFNRRFAAATVELRRWLARIGKTDSAPCVMSYVIHAGKLPQGHWALDPRQGGRILGEICHFVDLLAHLAGSPSISVQATPVRSLQPAAVGSGHAAAPSASDQGVSAILQFANGSSGSILYHDLGHSGMPKERLEISCSGQTALLDNFERVVFYSDRKPHVVKASGKGHAEEVRAFLEALRSGSPAPISFEEILQTTRLTFDLEDSLRSGQTLLRELPSTKPLASTAQAP